MNSKEIEWIRTRATDSDIDGILKQRDKAQKQFEEMRASFEKCFQDASELSGENARLSARIVELEKNHFLEIQCTGCGLTTVTNCEDERS